MLCENILPIEDFNRIRPKAIKSTWQPYCRKCQYAKQKVYAQQNAERINESNRRRRAERPRLPKGPKPKGTVNRFWEKVDKNGPIHSILGTSCWMWTSGLRDSGYGNFWTGTDFIAAHRFSYELHVGPIPDGLYVCHHCDNRPCCNPEHLFVGTHQDNMTDMVVKGRHYAGNHFLGETNPSAKLTEADVLCIRELAQEGAPRKQIAAAFGVSVGMVEQITSRRAWKHI